MNLAIIYCVQRPLTDPKPIAGEREREREEGERREKYLKQWEHLEGPGNAK